MEMSLLGIIHGHNSFHLMKIYDSEGGHFRAQDFNFTISPQDANLTEHEQVQKHISQDAGERINLLEEDLPYLAVAAFIISVYYSRMLNVQWTRIQKSEEVAQNMSLLCLCQSGLWNLYYLTQYQRIAVYHPCTFFLIVCCLINGAFVTGLVYTLWKRDVLGSGLSACFIKMCTYVLPFILSANVMQNMIMKSPYAESNLLIVASGLVLLPQIV